MIGNFSAVVGSVLSFKLSKPMKLSTSFAESPHSPISYNSGLCAFRRTRKQNSGFSSKCSLMALWADFWMFCCTSNLLGILNSARCLNPCFELHTRTPTVYRPGPKSSAAHTNRLAMLPSPQLSSFPALKCCSYLRTYMCSFLQFLPHFDLLSLLCSRPYKLLLFFVYLKSYFFHEVSHSSFLLGQFSGQTRDLCDLWQLTEPPSDIDVPVTCALNKKLPELDYDLSRGCSLESFTCLGNLLSSAGGGASFLIFGPVE